MELRNENEQLQGAILRYGRRAKDIRIDAKTPCRYGLRLSMGSDRKVARLKGKKCSRTAFSVRGRGLHRAERTIIERAAPSERVACFYHNHPRLGQIVPGVCAPGAPTLLITVAMPGPSRLPPAPLRSSLPRPPPSRPPSSFVWSKYSCGASVVFEQAAESLTTLNRSALRFRFRSHLGRAAGCLFP